MRACLALLLALPLAMPAPARAQSCEHESLTNVAYPVQGDVDVPLNPFLGPFDQDCNSGTCLEGPEGPVQLWQTAGHTWSRHYKPIDPLLPETDYTVHFGGGRQAGFTTGDVIDDAPPDELAIHEIFQQHDQDFFAFCPTSAPHVHIVFSALHDDSTPRERLRISYTTPEDEIVDVAYFPDNIDGSYSVAIPQGAGMVEVDDPEGAYEKYTVVVFDGAGNRTKKDHAPVEHYGCQCRNNAGNAGAPTTAVLLTTLLLGVMLRRRRSPRA